VPLPAGARSYAVAATLAAAPPPTPSPSAATLGLLHDRLLGDGLVPLDSALGRHADLARALPFDDTWIGYGMGHRELLTHPEVIAQVEAWLS
jgi:hypothetical protein